MSGLRQQRGLSLVELIIFLVILGILSTGFFLTFRQILLNADQPGEVAIATERAQGRLELILGQKRLLGFSIFDDPCDNGSPSIICTVTSRILPAALPLGVSGATEATLTVTGQTDDGSVVVTLTTVVGNY